ncbi:uncharacterized protein LOC100889880 [Strongylocentrotus purpuratus]|uniref:Uncharacterized protein n=1 Tax=Strongylocentrotus purpuratus TaxID=7668 RepID=A0A7M7GIN6_STRPU|nr:uncharacterized protein LOC100889880 [Strongylocentrotus purpuratus]XP_011664292.2 uncharacterized protein LOC100889880 [Strongylocentrotus purpuratus]
MQATSYPTQPGVPGQTFYGHQPAPVSYVIPVQNPNSSSGVSQNFNGAAGRATGWLQLSLGIGSIVVAIPELVLGLGVGFSGMGIWASVLFYIPTGILGICSMQKNTCVIVGYLTMCIITANVAFVQMLLGVIWTGITSVFLHDFGNIDHGIAGGSVAIDSLLAILGLIEMIVAIVASAYCCGGMACCNSSSQTTTTVYTQLNTPMVVTTGQYNVQQTYPPADQLVAPVPYNQAPVAPYNQAPGAPYNQARAAPHYQALGAPYNQQAAAAPTKPLGVVA